MSKRGSRAQRARDVARRREQRRAPELLAKLRREDALVAETHVLDHALGVRNKIIARLRDHLTDGERAELAELHRDGFDFDQAAADLAGWEAEQEVEEARWPVLPRSQLRIVRPDEHTS